MGAAKRSLPHNFINQLRQKDRANTSMDASSSYIFGEGKTQHFINKRVSIMDQIQDPALQRLASNDTDQTSRTNDQISKKRLQANFNQSSIQLQSNLKKKEQSLISAREDFRSKDSLITPTNVRPKSSLSDENESTLNIYLK